MYFYDTVQKMEKENLLLRAEVAKLEKQIASMPPGYILCSSSKTGSKWYYTNNRQRSYLPKSERGLAEQLAYKKFLEYRLKDLNDLLDASDAYLLKMPENSDRASKLFQKDSAYKELLDPFFRSGDQKISEWLEMPFKSNPYYPDKLIHRTPNGIFVRSKSEVIISSSLFFHHVPFRYECELELGGKIYYPDFMIMHPITYELWFWEHFGMFDDPEYIRKALNKLYDYARHDIVPGINMIVTYETANCPLDSAYVEQLVNWHFGIG